MCQIRNSDAAQHVPSSFSYLILISMLDALDSETPASWPRPAFWKYRSPPEKIEI